MGLHERGLGPQLNNLLLIPHCLGSKQHAAEKAGVLWKSLVSIHYRDTYSPFGIPFHASLLLFKELARGLVLSWLVPTQTSTSLKHGRRWHFRRKARLNSVSLGHSAGFWERDLLGNWHLDSYCLGEYLFVFYFKHKETSMNACGGKT